MERKKLLDPGGATKVWDAEKWSRKRKERHRGGDIQRIFPREIEI